MMPDSLGSPSTWPLEDALDGDDNALVKLRYPELREQFLDSIESQKEDIEAMVRRQMGVPVARVAIREIWRSGSFNIVIPIFFTDESMAYLRVALPYRIGEREAPGNVEEKLRAEIATYIWLQENCPDVPIPVLHAFGLPDGSTFTHPANTPLWERAWWNVRRWLHSMPGRPLPATHVRRSDRHGLEGGFLLISNAVGNALALSWFDHYHDPAYRKRLFQGLARISVSMNANPLPRIGSLSFRPDATIALCNRPLHLHFQMLENEGIPTGIPRNRTYAEVDSYISDLLSLHDNKIRNQPNAVHDQEDGRMQLAALTALRATAHHFTSPALRAGPFFYTLTDLLQHNIFVDEDWNVTTVIDLEWACSVPAQMQLPPYWLTSRAVDGLGDPESVAEYEGVLEEYLAAHEEEEELRNGGAVQAPLMREVWKSGGLWFFNAVTSPKGMYNLFTDHVQPLFNKEHGRRRIFDDVVYWYWGVGAQDMIDKKLEDRVVYRAKVREAFADL